MTKCKKWLFALVFAVCAALIAGGVLLGVSAASIYTTEDIFSFRNIVSYRGQALDDSDRSALAVTTGIGGEVFVNGEQSGAFSWEIGTEKISSYEVVFADVESGDAFSFEARLSGARAVVTLSYVADGKSREVSSVTGQNAAKINYLFDPSDMSVRVAFESGGQDFGVDWNDCSEFARYDVSLRVTGVSGEGIVNIYSVCGYGCITDNMYESNTFAPSLYAKAETNAVVGGGYALPVPYASVLGGETISQIDAEVYENGSLVAEGTVPDELSTVTFTESGNAEITYTAVSANGVRSVKTVSIEVMEADDVTNTFAPSSDCTDITIGTNTEHLLPYVENVSTFNVSENRRTASIVTVRDGEGKPLEGWDGIVNSTGQTIRFEKAGEYTVTFADRSGFGNTLSYTVTVDDEKVGIDGIETEEFYVSGSEFELQQANLYYKGESKAADVSVFAPDGTEYTAAFTFGMSGIYRLVYSAELGGQVRTVEIPLTVYDRSDSYFSSRTSEVAYESYGEDDAGVVITSSSSDEVVFERVIDVSGAKVETELITTEPNGSETFLQIKDKDNPSGYCLIDLRGNNSSASTLDFSCIYIRVTDLYDENNYFEIRVLDGAYYNTPGCFIRARASGQSFGGLAVRNNRYNEEGQEQLGVTRDSFNPSGGFLMSYNFLTDGYNHNRHLRLYYDNEEKALFGATQLQFATLIYDFDDPRFSSNPWDGFTTGEVKVSVTLSNISNSASLVLFEVGDYDLTSEYQTDTTSPVLTLDEAAEVQTYAIVGKPFRVFDAGSSDKNWSDVVVQAYLGEEEIPIVNGTFTPDRPAVYMLMYYAVDAFGNRSEPEYVSVRAQSAQPGIALTASGRETSAVLGRSYTLPEYELSGASGQITEFYGYRLKGSGTFIGVENGRIDFPATGTYEILYKVTDYLAQSAQDLYEVAVVASDEPLVEEEFSFYPVLYGGFAYEIPTLPAFVYTNQGTEQAEETVAIYDGDTLLAQLQPGESYTPSASLAGKTLTVQYSISGAAQLRTYECEVRAMDGNDKSVYFTADEGVTYRQENLLEDAEAVLGTGARPVFTMSADAGVAFKKELLAENFSVVFYFPQGAESVSSVKLTITDSRDPSEEIAITLQQQPSGMAATLDGSAWIACAGSWADVSGVLIAFSAEDGVFTDGIGNSIGSPVQTTDGGSFTGFSSGKVYFRIDLTGVTSEVSLCIAEINNQQMSMSVDRVAPELFIQGWYDDYDLGDTVTVLPAVSDDVLNQATTPTVSVQLGGTYLKDLNGLTLQNVPADQTYDFRIEEYGTYTILYSSSDTSSRGNLRTETVSFIVVDKEPPVAALSQSSLTVSAGESVDLAAMLTVSDNITPSGELRTVISVRKNRLREYVGESGTYTFTEAGRYYVDYLVRDGAENLVIVTLTVTAE